MAILKCDVTMGNQPPVVYLQTLRLNGCTKRHVELTPSPLRVGPAAIIRVYGRVVYFVCGAVRGERFRVATRHSIPNLDLVWKLKRQKVPIRFLPKFEENQNWD